MRDERTSFTVVVTGDTIAAEAMDILRDHCRTVFTGPYPDPELLMRTIRDEKADALIIRTGKATKGVVAASRSLKVIAKHGVGFDNIDVVAATAEGIPVMISATANYESVAEHTLALMFCLAKQIPWLDQRMRQGIWDKTTFRGQELYRKKLGLVGYGRIGRRVHALVAPLDMRVWVFEPLLPPDHFPPNVTRVSRLEDLLKEVDILSLHCPLTEQTRHLIGQPEMELMKKSAWLINTARGGLVDEGALINALEKRTIAAAALDTFEQEPPADIRRLSEGGRVVLTPHVGAGTEEAYIRMGIEAARNVLSILKGETPDIDYLVNREVLLEKG
ncbi:MAG: hydroxyacid dehydrogenase [Deltaproteobacteria bacterium]|nr:hydroxyacid dehydrogenase [Deltaproteobacteria bacterium]